MPPHAYVHSFVVGSNRDCCRRTALVVVRVKNFSDASIGFVFGCVATGWYNISPMGFALVSHGLVSGRSTHEDVDVSTHIQNGVAKASVPLMPYEGAGT